MAMSLYKLAAKMHQRPALFLRAVVEGWDMARIVREVY